MLERLHFHGRTSHVLGRLPCLFRNLRNFRMFRNFSLEPSEIFFLKGFEGFFFESRVEHKKNEGTAASRRRERPKRPETPRGPGSGPGARVRGPGYVPIWRRWVHVVRSGPIWRRGPGCATTVPNVACCVHSLLSKIRPRARAKLRINLPHKVIHSALTLDSAR